MRIPLGTEIGLSSGHSVLDGDPAPPRKGTHIPNFSAHVYCGQTVAHLSDSDNMFFSSCYNLSDALHFIWHCIWQIGSQLEDIWHCKVSRVYVPSTAIFSTYRATGLACLADGLIHQSGTSFRTAPIVWFRYWQFRRLRKTFLCARYLGT